MISLLVGFAVLFILYFIYLLLEEYEIIGTIVYGTIALAILGATAFGLGKIIIAIINKL